jgi:hypothetical protein
VAILRTREKNEFSKQGEAIMISRLSLAPLLQTAAAKRSIGWLSGLDQDDMLGWIGLAKSRSHTASNSALVAVGFLVGAAAAVLFTPASGKELRSRVGRRFGGGVGKQVGKQVGQLVGSHPVTSAEVVREARDVFSPARS